MSVHTTVTRSSQLVCGAVHAQTGGICKRPLGHAAQHAVSEGTQSLIWMKDPLSCKCGHLELCPNQRCVISVPVGSNIVQAANEDKNWGFYPD